MWTLLPIFAIPQYQWLIFLANDELCNDKGMVQILTPNIMALLAICLSYFQYKEIWLEEIIKY